VEGGIGGVGRTRPAAIRVIRRGRRWKGDGLSKPTHTPPTTPHGQKSGSGALNVREATRAQGRRTVGVRIGIIGENSSTSFLEQD